MTLPTLHISAEERSFSLRCDAMAVDGYALMVASAAGPHTSVQAVSAALQSGARLSFSVRGSDAIQTNGEGSGYLWKFPGGYNVYRHKLGFDTWHMLALAKSPELLTTVSEEAVWQALRKDRYTTPLLRGWLPYVTTELIASGLLKRLKAFGCEAAMLTASVEELDGIVSMGIRGGELRFA